MADTTQLSGMKYQDMSEEYRQNNTRDEFRSARKKENRMAGDAMTGKKGNPAAPKVDDINNFDTTAGGFGAKNGRDRFSKADIKNLRQQGYSRQEIIDYSNDKVYGEGATTKMGQGARDLLNNFRQKIAHKQKNKDEQGGGDQGGGDQGGGDQGGGDQDQAHIGPDNTETISGGQQQQQQQQQSQQKMYNDQEDAGNAVTNRTINGAYAPDDSNEATANFVNLHSGLNTQMQDKYKNVGMENLQKYAGFDARGYNPVDMENEIQQSIQESYDRADSQMGMIFGDVWHNNYSPGEWVMPKGPDKIEVDDDLGDEEMDRIEDM